MKKSRLLCGSTMNIVRWRSARFACRHNSPVISVVTFRGGITRGGQIACRGKTRQALGSFIHE